MICNVVILMIKLEFASREISTPASDFVENLMQMGPFFFILGIAILSKIAEKGHFFEN
jgi:hypothetical protein